MQLTNPDKSRTFAAIYMHENRLYILEATVLANASPPALFQQSMGFLDKDGVRVSLCNALFECVPATGARAGRSESADGMRVEAGLTRPALQSDFAVPLPAPVPGGSRRQNRTGCLRCR